MFVEKSSRHQEAHAKRAWNLVSALNFTSQNFWGPGFWIPTKVILSHPKVDWPCQNFKYGPTRKQPNVQPQAMSCPCRWAAAGTSVSAGDRLSLAGRGAPPPHEAPRLRRGVEAARGVLEAGGPTAPWPAAGGRLVGRGRTPHLTTGRHMGAVGGRHTVLSAN